MVLISNLHLHFFVKPSGTRLPGSSPRRLPVASPPARAGGGWHPHIPLGPILYGLLVLALVAAVVISIWWSSRPGYLRAWVTFLGLLRTWAWEETAVVSVLWLEVQHPAPSPAQEGRLPARGGQPSGCPGRQITPLSTPDD